MQSKPNLEIFADDVKASHGSTTGQVDPESLFYFLSRGIGKEMATSLLVHGFLSKIADKIPEIGLQARWLQKLAGY